MYSIDQCARLIRAPRDFAIDLDDGFEASFIKMGDERDELTVARGGRKVVMYIQVRGCDVQRTAPGALGARLVLVFGLECGPWRSTSLKSPAFDQHLAQASTILRRAFDRIDTDLPATWTANATRDAFLRSLSPACGPWIRRVLSAGMTRFALHRRALSFRRRACIRSAWRIWIEHFFDPDTPNGYMARRIHGEPKKKLTPPSTSPQAE